MEDSAFLWGMEVAREPGGHRGGGVFSAQHFNEFTKHIHCREARCTILSPSPHSACDLGIMACLGRACCLLTLALTPPLRE